MALSISSTSQLCNLKTQFAKTLPLSIFISNLKKPFSLNPQKLQLRPIFCAAAKQQSGSSVKSTKKKKKKGSSSSSVSNDLSLDVLEERESGVELEGENGKSKRSDVYVPLPLPKPPAGFVVNDQGRVLMAASRRTATIVDPTNNLPLECMIRRVFTNSKGNDCMLLCPVDTPVQILKSTNIEGWSAVSDEEVESLLPTAAYALAKIHMHLVHSGFCYTARGGFCYSEESIFEFRSDDGQDVDGVPTEGVEITCFHLDGTHYMIYTPSDPLLFVAVKDENGQLRIADDDLLDDPAVVGAIDEETEFNALVEEEAALLESVFGER
ncbi:ABC transporter A family member 5 [Bienertia sinuspersici]